MSEQTIEVITRAIIADNAQKKILFCAPKGDLSPEYFYLPGGHIEFGETVKSALIRELYEETGADASEAEFLFAGAHENIFSQGNNPHHEVNIYFEVRGVFSGNEDIPSLEEDIFFRWLSVEDIQNFPILPAGIKHFLFGWEPGKQIFLGKG